MTTPGIFHRVLLVSPDLSFFERINREFGRNGIEAIRAVDGLEGIRLWRRWSPDLMILDEGLSGIDGWSVLRHVRFEDKRAIILLLSSSVSPTESDKCRSYGGDELVPRSEGSDRLVRRIRRLLASSAGGKVGRNLYFFGGNQVDFSRRIAHCRHGTIRLTDQEVKLLKLFIKHRGEPLSRSRILELGWGYRPDVATRTVDNFMVRLRKYFERDPKHPTYFRSLRSVGYVFVGEPDGSDRS